MEVFGSVNKVIYNIEERGRYTKTLNHLNQVKIVFTVTRFVYGSSFFLFVTIDIMYSIKIGP